MRVAMVSEHASPLAVLGGVDAGGQNVHVAALARAMARQGVDVVVHTRRDDPGLPTRVPLSPTAVVEHVAAGPPVVIPKDELWPFMAEFADQLSASWQRRRPDVVHAHFWMSAWAAHRAARPLGIPVVTTFHALGVVKRRHQGVRDTSPVCRLEVERQLVRDVDRVVATCSDEVFELLRLGCDRKRISVVPCGVDLALFHPGGPSDPTVPGRHRLVFVGRVVERKGVGNAISALGMLRAAGGPDTELVIAGGPDVSALDSDPEVRRLRELSQEAGVADRVSFRGRVSRDRLPDLLRSADAVLCLPWYEPFGIVPLEAMACGVPVVATAVGGLTDSVVDGVTGLHVPPRRPGAVADVLAALLPDARRRRDLGRAGARRASARYSWERVARLTLQSYAELPASMSDQPLDKEVFT